MGTLFYSCLTTIFINLYVHAEGIKEKIRLYPKFRRSFLSDPNNLTKNVDGIVYLLERVSRTHHCYFTLEYYQCLFITLNKYQISVLNIRIIYMYICLNSTQYDYKNPDRHLQ